MFEQLVVLIIRRTLLTRGKRIIVADDTCMNISILARILSGLDVHIPMPQSSLSTPRFIIGIIECLEVACTTCPVFEQFWGECTVEFTPQ